MTISQPSSITEALYEKSPYRPLMADRGFDVDKTDHLFVQTAT